MRNNIKKYLLGLLLLFVFSTPGISGVPIPSSLHSYWKLDETSGTANNTITANFPLRVSGNVGSCQGKLGTGRGVYSAANSLYYAAGGSASTPYDQQTYILEMWISTNVTGTDQNLWVKSHPSVPASGAFEWSLGSDNKPVLKYNNVTKLASNGSSLADGTYHYLVLACVATSGADGIRQYNDGVMVASINGTTWTPSAEDLHIGISRANNSPMANIDDVAWHIAPTTNWTWIEQNIITPRYNGGAGAVYGTSGYDFKQKNFSNKNINAKGL